MGKKSSGIIALLVIGASFVGAAGAQAHGYDVTWRDRDARVRDYRGGSRDARAYSWKDDRYRDREERSYYYEDPYCGQRSSHVSDFKRHYGGTRHPLIILKVDIRSGRILDRYRYDRDEEEWRDGDRHSWCDDSDHDHGRGRGSRDRDD